MDQSVMPTPRLAPLPADHTPELAEMFEGYAKKGGYIPNSMLIMQRSPKLAKAFGQLAPAIFDVEGKVDRGFKRLIAFVCSRAAGCKYCMAHQVQSAPNWGVDEKKVDAIWDYQSSPLYSAAERAALDVAVAAGCVPNEVTDVMFNEMKKYWTEEQIVEIVGTIAFFGFLNRWNDTMATPLEEPPIAAGEKFLSSHGWDAGKHAR
jgi:uncharacterized peroxidase-related enzyme